MHVGNIKEKLGKFTGRLLLTGNAKSFINQPMGRNMVSKAPSDMLERLQLNTPSGYAAKLDAHSKIALSIVHLAKFA